jgi:hypothetical protein
MENNMSRIENLTLIEGSFTAEEAKEILMHVFMAKIHFHEIKNFSSEERLGVCDATALKRIPELKASIEKFLSVLSDAKASQMQLEISSEIKIRITNTQDNHASRENATNSH